MSAMLLLSSHEPLGCQDFVPRAIPTSFPGSFPWNISRILSPSAPWTIRSLGAIRLPCEKVGLARREILFRPLRGTKKGVIQAFPDPYTEKPRLQHTESEPAHFELKGFVLSRKFSSPTSEPLSGTVSALKCYRLMSSTKRYQNPRFDPSAVRRASPTFSYGSEAISHASNGVWAVVWFAERKM